MIRVLIVDGQPVVREGLRALIAVEKDIELAGDEACASDLVRLYEKSHADVVVIDPQAHDSAALDAIRALRRTCSRSRVVVLTNDGDEESVYRAVSAGAQGYVLKTDRNSDILDAIRAVHAGRRHLTARASARLVAHVGGSQLTSRERQVIELLALGRSNQRVARTLGISEETVKGHVKNILTKLGARSRTEAASIAIRRGIVRIDRD